VQRRLRELIEYMAWKSGWNALESYQHYFDVQRHAEIQDQLHKRMETALNQALQDRPSTHSKGSGPSPADGAFVATDTDFDYLYGLGGEPHDD
jgi:hypothetical protein